MRFPILGAKIPSWIPFEQVEPFRAQAMRNHQQTLERMAERGGLDWTELAGIATGTAWKDLSVKAEDESLVRSIFTVESQ